MMRKPHMRGTLGAGFFAPVMAMGAAGCELGVTNPGQMIDENINSPQALEALVAGMEWLFSSEYDDLSYFMAIAGGETRHTGAFEPEEFMARGEIEPRHVNARWANMHRARWSAETGVDRIREVLGENEAGQSPLLPETFLWAGYSNRALGENFCDAVIDGSQPQPHTVHFERAVDHFSEALAVAEGQNHSHFAHAAYAGRAQVRANLDDWAGARSDAAQVPDDFVWQALYHEVASVNWLVNESHTRRYYSVWETWVYDYHDGTEDPRVPYTDFAPDVGVDGSTPFTRQDKYSHRNSPISVSKGDEMRLIEAEAALRLDGDMDVALERINHVRGRAGVGQVHATNIDEAWELLRQERRIVLWLEGRYLWDLRRFDDPFLAGRDRCIPISENEVATNPNVSP